jgi:pimeloyl-ACP methyl ester carboxylesterase
MREKELMIPSSFGNLSAVINYPKVKATKLAILCPGYLDSKYYNGLAGLAETLAKEGYMVVRFEPTGTWESDGDISQYTSTQYLKDIKNVLEFMLKQSHFNHIVIGGHSRGGHMSLLYAARDKRVSCVIAIMPSSKRTALNKEIDTWKEKGFQLSYRDLPGQKNKRRSFNVPFSHLEDHLKYNVVEEVRRINIPLIFIAGGLDTDCPPEVIKEIFDRANEPKRFVIIPNIGHDYRHNISEVRIVDAKILELMKEMAIL